MSEQTAREALGDARPHWFNKQGDDCGPLPFTAEELKLLDAYRDEIRREVLAEQRCYRQQGVEEWSELGDVETCETLREYDARPDEIELCPPCTARKEKADA